MKTKMFLSLLLAAVELSTLSLHRDTIAERLSISLRKAGNRRHAICKAGAGPYDTHTALTHQFSRK